MEIEVTETKDLRGEYVVDFYQDKPINFLDDEKFFMMLAGRLADLCPCRVGAFAAKSEIGIPYVTLHRIMPVKLFRDGGERNPKIQFRALAELESMIRGYLRNLSIEKPFGFDSVIAFRSLEIACNPYYVEFFIRVCLESDQRGRYEIIFN